MRELKKVVSLALSAALLVSGISVGALPGQGKAAAVRRQALEVEMASGTVIQKGTFSDIVDSTVESTTTPPSITATITPTTTPTTTPTAAPTTSPSIVPTTPADVTTAPAVSGTAVKVGEEITSGNYIYIVEKEPTATSTGEVKVKEVREAARTKKTLTVQESVTKDGYNYLITGVGSKAFKKCTALKTVTIKKNVKFIGVRAFQGVSTLQQVNFKSTLEVIKKQAFAGCSSLRTITIPANVNRIGVKAFKNCTKLKAVIVKSKKITQIKSEAFKNTKSGSYLVIPSGKKSLYRNLLNNAKCTSVKLYVY